MQGGDRQSAEHTAHAESYQRRQVAWNIEYTHQIRVLTTAILNMLPVAVPGAHAAGAPPALLSGRPADPADLIARQSAARLQQLGLCAARVHHIPHACITAPE